MCSPKTCPVCNTPEIQAILRSTLITAEIGEEVHKTAGGAGLPMRLRPCVHGVAQELGKPQRDSGLALMCVRTRSNKAHKAQYSDTSFQQSALDQLIRRSQELLERAERLKREQDILIDELQDIDGRSDHDPQHS